MTKIIVTYQDYLFTEWLWQDKLLYAKLMIFKLYFLINQTVL